MLRDYLWTSAVSLFFIVSAIGLGGLLLKAFRISIERGVQLLLARFVAGFGVLYLSFVVLSLFGRLHRAEVICAIAMGALVVLVSLFRKGVPDWTPFRQVGKWDRMDLFLLGCVVLLVGLQLAGGLTPLIFYDSQVYHLFAPAQFLLSGSLTHLPWNVHASSPLAGQLTIGMTLALDPSGQAAKLLYAVLGCLFAPAPMSWSGRTDDGQASLRRCASWRFRNFG